MSSSKEQLQRRILVIDDNPAIHDDFRKTLCRQGDDSLAEAEAALFGSAQTADPNIQFCVDAASQGEEGLARLNAALAENMPYQLAFVDMRMPPGWDGVQTIARLWEVDPSLQVVICTAYSDYSWNQIIEKLGVSDRMLILKKPFDPAEVCQLATTLTEKWLLSRRAQLKLAELETLVEQRTADLKNAALHDKLTGLPNRALVHERLTRILYQHKRDPDRHYAVLFLDFDRFKLINDSLGHDVGDLLLQAIAMRLSMTLRETDTVARPDGHTAARLGGDEFIILLDGLIAPTDAARIAERLLKELSRPYDLRGHIIHSTVSIGVTTSAHQHQSADDAIRDADAAMYQAKAGGKGQFVFFDQRMHEHAVNRLSLQRDLQQAIERGELHLAYQPIISLMTGAPMSFEALMRWNHPTRGLVSPTVFIEMAEETTLIQTLGEWALREATTQWARIIQQPEMRHVSISVNLSRRQLASRQILQVIDAALQGSGLPASHLRLEITESAIIADMDSAVSTLEAISARGITLDIDDFGTGYSSMSCLHRFPISGLKIDRSFINGISERRDYAAVVEAIVTLAKNLGIEIVAEGVETHEQTAMLQSMGVDHAQGYLFAKPLPLIEALQTIPTLIPARMVA